MRFKTVFRVTLVYLVLGLLWIYLSDKFLYVFFGDDVVKHAQFQTVKGFFYIVFTTLLLGFLMKRFSRELKSRLEQLQESKTELKRSEKNYRLLFDSSPLPVFIYEPRTDRILKANNAAQTYYGYNIDEFSVMTMQQIEDAEEPDMTQMEDKLNISHDADMAHADGIHRHKKKNGELMFVNVQGSVIDYKGTKAEIVIVNDITEQLSYIDAIEKQNKKLNDIAWMQSHVVRAPLASLMGLAHLLADEKAETTETREEILVKLLASANELDGVIKKISEQTSTEEVVTGK